LLAAARLPRHCPIDAANIVSRSGGSVHISVAPIGGLSISKLQFLLTAIPRYLFNVVHGGIKN
jgi:hypothetical protein